MQKIILLFCLFFLLIESNAQQNESTVNNTTTKDLKILSWNIFMLPPFVHRTGKRTRVKAIANYVKKSDYDVLVFQEMFLHAAKRKLRRRIKKEYPYQVGPAYKRFISLRTSSGIYIASKYPMQKIGKTKFKQKEGADNKLARKGALMVEVNKNDKLYHIIGTHLNAGGSDETKMSQVDQIATLIKKEEKDSVPIFICGDFNIDKKDAKLYPYTLNKLQAEDGEIIGDWNNTIDSKNNDMCGGNQAKVIDFIFYKSNGLQYKSIERSIPRIELQWCKEHKKFIRPST
ncbi:MAG: sphingomyelin phosphodiesterase [Chitinophagales bacterium]